MSEIEISWENIILDSHHKQINKRRDRKKTTHNWSSIHFIIQTGGIGRTGTGTSMRAPLHLHRFYLHFLVLVDNNLLFVCGSVHLLSPNNMFISLFLAVSLPFLTDEKQKCLRQACHLTDRCISTHTRSFHCLSSYLMHTAGQPVVWYRSHH